MRLMSVSPYEIVTMKINNDLCHDHKYDNKYNLQCKVLIENVDIIELVKMSPNKRGSNIHSENDKKRVLTVRLARCETANIKSVCHLVVSEETHEEPEKVASRNEENTRLIPSIPAKTLRKQIRPNYAEITLDTSQETEVLSTPEKKIATKVPVYKQQIEDKKIRVPDNLYEFDESDSDRDKRQRKGKRFPNKSRKRNAPLNIVSQKNDMKTSAKSKIIWQQKGYKILKNSPKKYNEIMQEIVQKVMKKVNHEHKPVTKCTDLGKNLVQVSQVPACKILTVSTSNKRDSKGVLESNLQKGKVGENKKLVSSSGGLTDTGQTFSVVKAPAQKVLTSSVPHLEFIEMSSENIKIRDSFNRLATAKDNYKAKTGHSNKENVSPIDHQTIVGDNSGDIFPPELEINSKSAEQENLNEKNTTEIYRASSFDKDGSSDIFPLDTSNYETGTQVEKSAHPNFLSSTNVKFISEKRTTQIDPEVTVVKDSSGDLFPSEINNESLTNHNSLQRQLSPSSKIDNGDDLTIEDVVDSDYDNRSEQGILDDSFLELEGSPLKTIPKINVISDVVLTSVKHNPWRFNDYIRRNPHFIMLKTTALPCLKQDMVLDHSQIEKIEEHFSKTPRRLETPRKSPVQKSILDYVNDPQSNDKENHPPSSLFNNDDFSPIKIKSSQQSKERNKVKRNILAPIQDNALNTGPFTSTPARSNRKKVSFNATSVRNDENEDIANCFGFDEDGDVTTSKGAVKRSVDKPYRIYGKIRKKNVEAVEELEESVPVQEPDESQVAVNSMDVELFEDPEKDFTLSVPSKIYVRKPRRKRLKSVEVENEENHPKKRKKDIMTKAEEAELENWAAEFNSMCAEIEKYDLEID